MKAAQYQDPSTSPPQYGSDVRVDVMLEEMKKRQQELFLLQEKIKHEPLVKMPFKDRDLLRFPSIMDDRKQFDKYKYIESPLINSIMNRNNRQMNGESIDRVLSINGKRSSMNNESQFDSLISRFMLKNRGDRHQTQLMPLDSSNFNSAKKSVQFQPNYLTSTNLQTAYTQLNQDSQEQKLSPRMIERQMNITELKQKRKVKFDTLLKDRKSRSRIRMQPGGLTVNNFNSNTVQKLSKILPMKDLLNCSAELYDMYHTTKFASSPQRSVTNFNKSPSPTKESFQHCFPSHDYTDSPKHKEINQIAVQRRDLRMNMELVRRSLVNQSSLSPVNERLYFKKEGKMFTTEFEIRKIQDKILRPPTPKELKQRNRNQQQSPPKK